jgi:hypothetical protein
MSIFFVFQKLKLNDFVSPSQLPDLRKTIHYGKKSIAIRKTLPGTYHKVSLPRTRNNIHNRKQGKLSWYQGDHYII